MDTNDERAENECPTCGPTTAEQHPRRPGVARCGNCKEQLHSVGKACPVCGHLMRSDGRCHWGSKIEPWCPRPHSPCFYPLCIQTNDDNECVSAAERYAMADGDHVGLPPGTEVS